METKILTDLVNDLVKTCKELTARIEKLENEIKSCNEVNEINEGSVDRRLTARIEELENEVDNNFDIYEHNLQGISIELEFLNHLKKYTDYTPICDCVYCEYFINNGEKRSKCLLLDPNVYLPDAPISPYQYFKNEKGNDSLFKKIEKENPHMRKSIIRKIISDSWDNLPEKEKEKYYKLYDADKIRFKKDMYDKFSPIIENVTPVIPTLR